MGKGMRAGKANRQRPGKQGDMAQQQQMMQALQSQMETKQLEIDEMEQTATAGGGAITVTVNGKKEITTIKFKPEIVDPDDIEMLEDLTLTAVNEALR
ncbi:MAG: YbaB/EbfC family nucleoid-associated protein, partial [Anaerovoracaceae bacterium]